MDGIIAPLEARIRAIELHLWGPPADDSGHDVPAQTLAPSRMPLTPGAPIGNYDPSVAQDDETDAAVNAENEWKTSPKPAFIPPSESGTADGSTDDLDPTLNEDGTPRSRRRRNQPTIDGDVT